jgi:hypothetical protein
MNNSLCLGLSLVGILALGCGSATPKPSANAAAPAAAAPAAPAEAQRLAAMLAGHWKGSGTLTMDGKPVPLEFDLKCEAASSSWAVTCQARCVGPDGHLHEETHLWGYNAETAKVHFFAVTTDGDVHDHVGTFTEKGLAVQYTGTMQGKPFTESLWFETTAPGAVHFRNETTVGGAPFLGLDMTFKR